MSDKPRPINLRDPMWSSSTPPPGFKETEWAMIMQRALDAHRARMPK